MSFDYYTIDELLADESFRRWVLNPTRETTRHWEKQLTRHPEKAAEVQEARRILLATSQVVNQPPVNEEQLASLWQRIQHTVARPDAASAFPSAVAASTRSISGNWGWKVAASVALLFGAGLIYWLVMPTGSERTVATQQNEQQTVALPDGSQIILNERSTLRYPTDWQGGTREVWLEGEAFFHVKPQVRTANETTASAQGNGLKVKFVVHTASLDVEVYGTRFSVSSEPRKSQVVLQSGEVTVQTAADARRIVMQPGDFVEVTPGNTVHKPVNSALYTAWKEEKLVFEQVPVAEVAEWIQDRYNQTVILKKPALDTLHLTATLPSSDLAVLLETLSLIYKLHVEQPDDHTIILE